MSQARPALFFLTLFPCRLLLCGCTLVFTNSSLLGFQSYSPSETTLFCACFPFLSLLCLHFHLLSPSPVLTPILSACTPSSNCILFPNTLILSSLYIDLSRPSILVSNCVTTSATCGKCWPINCVLSVVPYFSWVNETQHFPLQGPHMRSISICSISLSPPYISHSDNPPALLQSTTALLVQSNNFLNSLHLLPLS